MTETESGSGVYRETAFGESRDKNLFLPLPEQAVKAAGLVPRIVQMSGYIIYNNLGGNTESFFVP